MNEIGAYEAKTHLPSLLERVRKGERFVITNHGQPVAELVPVAARNVEQIRKAIAELRRLRGDLAKRGVSLKSILKKGETLRDLTHQAQASAWEILLAPQKGKTSRRKLDARLKVERAAWDKS